MTNSSILELFLLQNRPFDNDKSLQERFLYDFMARMKLPTCLEFSISKLNIDLIKGIGGAWKISSHISRFEENNVMNYVLTIE